MMEHWWEDLFENLSSIIKASIKIYSKHQNKKFLTKWKGYNKDTKNVFLPLDLYKKKE